MINPIYVRTQMKGQPRELMVNGELVQELNLSDLAAFACAILTSLGEGKDKLVTVDTPSGPVELEWEKAHELALSAASSMRWG